MTHTKHTNDRAAQASPKPGVPWPLILILAIIIVPIIAAYIAFYTGIGVSDETVNEGVLLKPAVDVSELTGTVEGGPLPDFTDRKWRLLVPVAGACNEGCQKNLYTTRQVHIRLGDKSPRVERWAVNLSGEQGEAFLANIQDKHPLLEHFSVTPEEWRRWLADTNIPKSLEQQPYYLLVDQEGFAMMFYTVEHHGNELLDDVKRVLRYTPE